MKKFNDFMYGGSKWKVALFTFSFFFAFSCSFFIGIELISGIDIIAISKSVMVSTILSGIFTLLVMNLISMSKQSQLFWDKAKEVELFIGEAETIEEIKAIYEGEFVTLKQMSSGTPHRYEVLRLLTIMDTKSKYLK